MVRFLYFACGSLAGFGAVPVSIAFSQPKPTEARSSRAEESPRVEGSSRADGTLQDTSWQLVAVEFARSEVIPTRRLISGAGRDDRVDMSWYFFVASSRDRVVLIDVGTDAFVGRGGRALRRRWRIREAVSVADALGRAGFQPDDVTDVVLTHHHWDHVGALGTFLHAVVHTRRGTWSRIARRVRQPFERRGQVALIGSASAELWLGFQVRQAGVHTAHHLMVQVGCEGGPVVLAGDAAYLFRNVSEGLPVTVSVSSRRNVVEVAEAAREVRVDRVLPGHDPELFQRFPSSQANVAAICPMQDEAQEEPDQIGDLRE